VNEKVREGRKEGKGGKRRRGRGPTSKFDTL